MRCVGCPKHTDEVNALQSFYILARSSETSLAMASDVPLERASMYNRDLLPFRAPGTLLCVVSESGLVS